MASSEFRELLALTVRPSSENNPGYDRETIAVVRRCIEEATRPPFRRIVQGMDVQSVDGQDLGKIVRIWNGAEPVEDGVRCDTELCSQIEVRRVRFRVEANFVPVCAIVTAEGRTVTLDLHRSSCPVHGTGGSQAA